MIPTIYDLFVVAAIVCCLVVALRAHAHSTKTGRFAVGLAHLLRGQQNTTEYLLEVTSKQRKRIEALEANQSHNQNP